MVPVVEPVLDPTATTTMTMTPPPLPLPTIDFSPFTSGDVSGNAPSAEQLETAAKINDACRQHGFVHLTNIDISPELYRKAFEGSKLLFDLPNKSQLPRINPQTNMGYAPFRSERLNKSRGLDLKEAFNVRFPPVHKNNFDSCPTEFVEASQELIEAFRVMTHKYAVACAMALGLHDSDEDISFFADTLKRMDLCTIRFLHYPPVLQEWQDNDDDGSRKPAIRIGEHTDFGIFTFLLLAPGALEGLQVLPVEGGEVGGSAGGEDHAGWRHLSISNSQNDDSNKVSAIVNTGALMARWTNDVWRATAHRVVVPTKDAASRDRYSIACFADPDSEAVVDVHEKLLAKGEVKKYGPITSKAYLSMKLNESQLVNEEKEKA